MEKLKQIKRWKLLVISGAIIAGGASISAADNYFEITKNLEIFTELYKELNIYYVDETQPGELMKTGIDAMLNSLDPYTNYIAESDIENYRFMTTGQYGGIGALIKKKGDDVVISEPYEGFPAQKAGVHSGDVIISIDGENVSGKGTEDVSNLLKGQAGTKVMITFQRPGEAGPQQRELLRENIQIPDVPYHGMLEGPGKVGYIKLTSFTPTASNDVREAMKELRDEKGMEKLILDLRGNGGGLLREAVNIVNLFVDRGQLVVETKGKIAEWDKTYKTLSEPLDKEMPLVILVDPGSASASEIVSGALQDLDRAVVIGDRTFGKGLVQQTRDLFYNAKLKLTVAKYYIPSGRCIQKIDYSSRDKEGKAISVADSLIAEFKTKKGRPVFDGRGILPDVKMDEFEMPRIIGNIAVEDLFFEYANAFFIKHPTIPPASEFKITNEIYDDFIAFVASKNLEFRSHSEEQLEELIKTAKKEEHYTDAASQFDALEKALHHDTSEDLEHDREDIEYVLVSEIVSRYYYQTGRVVASLAIDPYVAKANDVFGNGTYKGILDGSIKSDN